MDEVKGSTNQTGLVFAELERGAGWSALRRRKLVVVVSTLSLNRLVMLAAVILALGVLSAAFAPWIAPTDPIEADIRNRFQPPVWYPDGTRAHILGTDQLGRDILSRLIYGARVSLLVGFASAFLGGTLGMILGLISGYFGGRIDSIIMRVVDI